MSRTNVRSVWAVGDVTNRINLTPVALMEGMAFAQTCFGEEPLQPDYDFVPSAVFCQPPLASGAPACLLRGVWIGPGAGRSLVSRTRSLMLAVGYTEESAVAMLSGKLDIFVSKFRPMKNTLSGRDEKTIMKMIVHAESGRVVGCHM